MKRAQLPPEMAQFFSAYIEPEALAEAQLVETNEPLDIWVSYVPRLRCFSAHREGIGTMQAGLLPELLTKIAEAMPEANLRFHLSKVARAEVAARRRRIPRADGWS